MNWKNRYDGIKVGTKIKLLGTKCGSTGLFDRWFTNTGRYKGDIVEIANIEGVDRKNYFTTNPRNPNVTHGYLCREDFVVIV